MEIKLPEDVLLVLIQEIEPLRKTSGKNYDYRPPMLVIGREWGRIDRHQRGILKVDGQDEMEFTGLVPSADHDKQQHVEMGTVKFGKMKWRHLENCKFTEHCVGREDVDLDHSKLRGPDIVVRDREKLEKCMADL